MFIPSSASLSVITNTRSKASDLFNSVGKLKLSVIKVQLSNYLHLENQLWELQTGKDIARIFEKENVLQKNRDRKVFQEALQAVRRNDLAVKLEKYIVKGTSI